MSVAVIVQVWGPVNDQAGGGWGWFPIARLEDPETTDAAALRPKVLELIERLEQRPASNVARLEFRQDGRVLSRATLVDLW